MSPDNQLTSIITIAKSNNDLIKQLKQAIQSDQKKQEYEENPMTVENLISEKRQYKKRILPIGWLKHAK